MADLGRLQESDCFPREKLSQILESSHASVSGPGACPYRLEGGHENHDESPLGSDRGRC